MRREAGRACPPALYECRLFFSSLLCRLSSKRPNRTIRARPLCPIIRSFNFYQRGGRPEYVKSVLFSSSYSGTKTGEFRDLRSLAAPNMFPLRWAGESLFPRPAAAGLLRTRAATFNLLHSEEEMGIQGKTGKCALWGLVSLSAVLVSTQPVRADLIQRGIQQPK